MIDLLQAVLAIAMVVVIGVWILRRFSGPLLRAEKPEDAVEEARAMAVDIGWDELDIERLDRKRAFKRHVERLSEPDVPFAELAQMAHSPTPGIAALGLSAIARRDDVPEKWPQEALRSIRSSAFMVEPFVYRAILETATYPVIGPALATLSDA